MLSHSASGILNMTHFKTVKHNPSSAAVEPEAICQKQRKHLFFIIRIALFLINDTLEKKI